MTTLPHTSTPRTLVGLAIFVGSLLPLAGALLVVMQG